MALINLLKFLLVILNKLTNPLLKIETESFIVILKTSKERDSEASTLCSTKS